MLSIWAFPGPISIFFLFKEGVCNEKSFPFSEVYQSFSSFIFFLLFRILLYICLSLPFVYINVITAHRARYVCSYIILQCSRYKNDLSLSSTDTTHNKDVETLMKRYGFFKLDKLRAECKTVWVYVCRC